MSSEPAALHLWPAGDVKRAEQAAQKQQEIQLAGPEGGKQPAQREIDQRKQRRDQAGPDPQRPHDAGPVCVVEGHAGDVDTQDVVPEKAQLVLVVEVRQADRHEQPEVRAENGGHDRKQLHRFGVRVAQPEVGVNACGPGGQGRGKPDDPPGALLPRPLGRMDGIGVADRGLDRVLDRVRGDGLGGGTAAAEQQLGHRHVQRFGQRDEQGRVRQAQTSLPFADSFVGDEQPFGQLALGEALFLPQPGKKAAKGFFVQFVHIQSPRGVLLAPV